MGSPFRSALAKLDDSVQNLEHQLGCLRGGLDVGDDQLWQALNDSHQSAAALREMVRAERPDADWSDRATLEILIQHLECEAQAKRDEQRRARLFELANELDAGAVKHRFESRVSALNSLRLQAIRELRIAATLFEQEKELPGPQASEWLSWACNLREESDGPIFTDLRRDFPALERFTSEMEENYWVPSPREQKPATQSSATASSVVTPATPPAPRPSAIAVPADVAPRNTRFQPEPTPQTDSKAARVPSYQSPSNGRSSAPDLSTLASLEAAVATTTRDSYRALDKVAEQGNGNGAVGELNASSTVKMWTVPTHPAAATPTIDESSTETEENGSSGEITENLLPSFGAEASTKKPIAVWIAVGTILALGLIFAGTYYFSSASGKSNERVAHAAASPAAGPDSGAQPQGAGLDSATAGQPAKNGAAGSSAALIQPVEGAQHQILLNMESCRRSNSDSVDCQGYVTNLSNEASHVTLDSVDVVDGKGNSFNLNSGGQFNFASGRSLSLAAGSRAKYTVKVPDKDREARTLTVYVDVNNPHGLEYTFRNVPIAE